MKFFITGLGLALIACQSFRAVQQQQGLSGIVYRESGNRMPAPNRKKQPRLAIRADVYIYRATTQDGTEGQMPVFTKINTQLVAHLTTDSTGHFTIALATGKYSVFIKSGAGFYAGDTDDQGVLNPVTILPGNLTEKNFVIRNRAVY